MADVAAALKDWSSTTSSNAPSGGTTIGAGLDDNLREIQGAITRGLSYKGADIASASTTDLGAVEGLMHDITGTTTITSFGTVRAGIWKIIKFEGTLTLTHNATSLILPGAANITAQNGDTALMMSEGSGNWRCISYTVNSQVPAYLEGSWTPAIVGTGGGPLTFSTAVGSYIRTGNLVWVTGRLTCSGGVVITGNISITGLPFTSSNTSGSFGTPVTSVNFGLWGGTTLDSGYTQLGGFIGLNKTTIEIYESGSTKAVTALPGGNVGVGTDWVFSGVYRIG